MNAPTPAGRHLVTGLLSLVAGLADCLGWLLLGGAFTAHITGNVVVAAGEFGRGRLPAAGPLLAVPAFILVTAAATLLAARTGRALVLQRWLLCAQTVLLVAAALVAPSGAVIVTLLLAVCAMAVQNALLHLLVTPAPSTAVMTGNVVVATVALVRLLSRPADRRADAAALAATWPLIAGFIAGCVIAAPAATVIHDGAWFVPAAVSTALTGWLWTRTTQPVDVGGRSSPGERV